MRREKRVRNVILDTVGAQKGLSLGIVFVVIGAVVAALIPPLILARMVDTVTEGKQAALVLILLYFGMLALAGVMESAREGLLTVFGQKMTHALRSSLMDKFTRLTTDCAAGQEPGTLVSRFVGDVDTVENLFTSGIVSMFADACKLVGILTVIWFRNRGLTVVLLALLHRQIGLLSLPDDEAQALGVSTGVMRMLVLVAATLLAAAVSASAGVVAFLPLLAPHGARLLLRGRTKGLLPLSALTGGVLLLLADIAARLAPGAELPVSVLTTMLGVPCVAMLMAKGGARRE